MPTFFARHADTFATIATLILAFVGLVALVEQRFNAQEKLINQRFDAVNQRFGAVDQRFGAVNQRFDAQDRRIDGLEADIAQRFDAQDRRIDDLEADIEQRFDVQARYIDQGFAAVNQRLDRLTGETSELRKLTTSIVERVSRNEREIDVIREQSRAVDVPAP
jgi:chromosome segregation ATPase